MIFALSSFIVGLFASAVVLAVMGALIMIWVVLDAYGQSKSSRYDIDSTRANLVGVVAFALFWGLFILLGALASGSAAFLP